MPPVNCLRESDVKAQQRTQSKTMRVSCESPKEKLFRDLGVRTVETHFAASGSGGLRPSYKAKLQVACHADSLKQSVYEYIVFGSSERMPSGGAALKNLTGHSTAYSCTGYTVNHVYLSLILSLSNRVPTAVSFPDFPRLHTGAIGRATGVRRSGCWLWVVLVSGTA